MSKRKPAYAALFVIGLALLPLAIAGNPAFWGVSVVFFVVGAVGLAREKKAARQDKDDQGAT
jgi:asparagine N-glycosylation enzyme membrane subunit Stt3